jgi:hypothetical protein
MQKNVANRIMKNIHVVLKGLQRHTILQLLTECFEEELPHILGGLVKKIALTGSPEPSC